MHEGYLGHHKRTAEKRVGNSSSSEEVVRSLYILRGCCGTAKVTIVGKVTDRSTRSCILSISVYLIG